MPDRVSVIVPAYNAAAYLAEALESALQQRGAELEVVVVDDGSTDDTWNVANRFRPRVRILQQTNRGIAAARNAALKTCDAPFIAFLDADDIWPSGRLETLLTALQSSPAAGIAAGLVRCFASPELDPHERARIHVPPGDSPGSGMAGASLVRRTVMDRIGAFDETLRVGEMVDWYLRLRDAGVVQVLIDDVVLLRRLHGTNQGRRHSDSRTDYLRALRSSLGRRKGGDSA